MTVNVNGKEKELEYRKNGCDLSRDVVGTFDDFSTDEETRILMTPSDFDWWTEEFEKLEEIDDILDDLLLSDGDYDQFIDETFNNDLEIQTDEQLEWLQDCEKNNRY